MTLIELVISMIIISISLVGILSVITVSLKSSADPMIRNQSVSIAESYMEEILLNPYDDPDTSDTEVLRSLFDDVDDYHGLTDSGVHDQSGNPIAALSTYNVSVDVSSPLSLTGGVTAKKVTVSVANSGFNVDLVAYRTDY